MFNKHYHELMVKIKKHERKKNCLLFSDYIPDKVLGKIKEITGIVKI